MFVAQFKKKTPKLSLPPTELLFSTSSYVGSETSFPDLNYVFCICFFCKQTAPTLYILWMHILKNHTASIIQCFDDAGCGLATVAHE